MIDPQQPDFSNTPASERRPAYDYLAEASQPTPRVSVVTPFYNAGGVFRETARSLERQSLQSWEWIIVNDGSTTPPSLQMLAEYRATDPRIRVLDRPANAGLSAARNAGVQAARSRFVFFLDDDDLLEPTALEKSLWFLESHPAAGFVDAFSVGFGAAGYLWTEGFRRRERFLSENLATSMVMVRTEIHRRVGGFDESIRGGMEDWDFWLRCAAAGIWGDTIPEYFGWYRRRADHGDRWPNLASPDRRQAFRAELRRRYPRLYAGEFPPAEPDRDEPFAPLRSDLPCENRLRKRKPRLLMILPWLALGGAEKFSLGLLQQLTQRGWEVSIAATQAGNHTWMPRFARHTPDIFALHHFLRPTDQPAFLRYLIRSRSADCVLISASELGYCLLPYLRRHCPEPTYVDFNHMADETWKDGGFPRLSVAAQSQLDLSVVSSTQLKEWMTARGAPADRIEVAYVNVDPQAWQPSAAARAAVRRSYDLPEDRVVILYAGRICEQKQPRVFAGVMRALAEGGVDYAALVAGDGPDRQWLADSIDAQRLTQHVRLLGPQGVEQMQQLMAAGDIFFLPSRCEGIAITIYEAMASGLAVVAADVGGQRELVTPDCGRLVPRGAGAEEIERYTRELTELIADPDLRRTLGRSARARVQEHFRLDQMGQRMIDLFSRAAELQHAAPRTALDAAFAQELAAQAVELERLTARLDRLWQDHQQLQQTLATHAQKLAFLERLRRQAWWPLARRLARAVGFAKA